MNVEQVVVAHEVGSPDPFQELLAADDDPRIAREGRKQLELQECQLHARAID